MYDVTIYNGDNAPIVIHDHRAASNAQKLTTASIVDAVNSISSLQFEINPANAGYDALHEYTTLIRVRNTQRSRDEFVGRVLQIVPSMSSDGKMCRSVVCEDRLGYLHDSRQPYMLMRHFVGDAERNGLEEFIDLLLANHNAQVEAHKRIYRGTVTVNPFKTSDNVTKGLNWEDTYECIADKLIGSFGGFIVLREGDDGRLYLDYLESVGTVRETAIELGRNMSSIKREAATEDIVTRLIVLGAKLEEYQTESGDDLNEERLTIESVNGGKPYIESPELVEKYGIRYGTVVFDEVTDPKILLRKGQEYFNTNSGVTISHNVSALELSLIGLDYDDFVMYDSYPVRHRFFGINEVLQIVKKTTNIIEPLRSSFEMGDIWRRMSDIVIGSIGNVQQQITNIGNRVTKQQTEITTIHGQIQQTVTKTVFDETLKEVIETSESSLTQTADEIMLEVNKKLGKDDAAVGVVAGSSVKISEEEVDISTSKFSVNIKGKDGETNALIINEDGATFQALTSPDVAPRYAGATLLHVDPAATSAQIETGYYYRSLADALAAINNRWLAENVSINLAANAATYGDLVMSGLAGCGAVNINASSDGNATLYGTLEIKQCANEIKIVGLNVSVPADSYRAAYTVRSNAYANIKSCTISGNQRGFEVENGGNLDATDNTFLIEHDDAARVSAASRAYFGDCIGNGRLYCHRGLMAVSGKVPTDGTVYAETFEPNNLDSLVPTGADGQPVAPTIVTKSYAFTGSDSYCTGWSYFSDNDVRQGYTSGYRIRGCMWFDAATIAADLAGKTIRQASLRLTMQKGVGRGVAVSVQLYGTNMQYSGRSGAPELTTSYGSIATTNPGETHEITIPNQVMTDLANGTICALVLRSDDTDYYDGRTYSRNYARFDGETTGDESTQPRLTVIYEQPRG